MKRILALILCFVMVFSLVAVAEETATAPVATTEFSDVPATSPYKEAISTLTGLGIILGDAGANTFRPEAGITRAEFCVIVARLKNLGALNVIAETSFTDVTTALCDEWKVKAVRIASDLGIVAGMGDGTFAPDAPVTYEQAVKMLVCLLKYEPMAKTLGGWPAGYIAAGAQIGLTKKAVSVSTEPAPRQIIAQLVFNALDIPEMGNTSNGVTTGGSTILDNNLKVQEKKGIVTATSTVSLVEGTYVPSGRVQIDYDKIYNVGSSGADKYFGKEISFFYSSENGNYVIENCSPTKSNNESTFEPNRIKHLGQNEIEVYTDDELEEFDYYSVASDVKLVYNNAPAPYVESSAGYLDATYKPYSGSLRLIDNDDDNTIDVIIINDAKPFVVSSIDTSKKLLYNLYDSSDVLDLKEGSGKNIIITKGSSTVSFSSIAKNNVLLVSKSLNTTGTKHITVEIVSNTKTGVIKGMNIDDRTITIASSQYEISDLCWNKYSSRFKMDNSVTVYLDNHNTVLYVVENTAAASSYTYGYLMSAGKEEGTGVNAERVMARIFTQSGLISTYPLAEEVKYYGYDPEAEDGSILSGDKKSAEEVLNLLSTTERTDINKDPDAVNKTEHSQFIKYSLNARGEIGTVFTSVTKKEDRDSINNLILGVGTSKGVYKANSKMLGSSLVNDSTKFFFIPTDRKNTDEYAVGNRTSLASDSISYHFETYDIEDGYAKIALVFGDISLPVYYYTTPTVVVSQIIDINTEDGPAHKFFINGSESEYYTTKDSSVLSGVKKGDVLKLKVNKKGTLEANHKGVVEEKMKLFSPASGELYKFESGAERYAATDNSDIRKAKESSPYESYFCVMYGTVSERFDETMLVSLADVVVEKDSDGKIINATLDRSKEYPVTLASSTKFYTYSKSKGTVEKIQTLVSFEDAKVGASKVYISSVDGVPKFILTVID